MITGRWGQEVTIKRHAKLGDVFLLDEREPDEQDYQNLVNGCYVVVEDYGKERLYALAFLRADDGSKEIHDTIERVCGLPYPYADATVEELRKKVKEATGA